MVALLVDEVFGLLILALVIIDRDLDRVLVNHLVELHGLRGKQRGIGKGKFHRLAPVVDGELAAQKQLQLLEELRDRPMRQRTGEARSVPGIRERVADKEILVFLLFFPLREVSRVAYSLANLLRDVKKIRLPRAAPAVGVPRVVRVRLQRAVGITFLRVEVCEVLNIARIVVDPRQSHALHIVYEGVPRLIGRGVGGLCRRAKVKFVDEHIIESDVEVLLRAAFEELRLDLGIVDFGNGDRTELVEAFIA